MLALPRKPVDGSALVRDPAPAAVAPGAFEDWYRSEHPRVLATTAIADVDALVQRIGAELPEELEIAPASALGSASELRAELEIQQAYWLIADIDATPEERAEAVDLAPEEPATTTTSEASTTSMEPSTTEPTTTTRAPGPEADPASALILCRRGDCFVVIQDAGEALSDADQELVAGTPGVADVELIRAPRTRSRNSTFLRSSSLSRDFGSGGPRPGLRDRRATGRRRVVGRLCRGRRSLGLLWHESGVDRLLAQPVLRPVLGVVLGVGAEHGAVSGVELYQPPRLRR